MKLSTFISRLKEGTVYMITGEVNEIICSERVILLTPESPIKDILQAAYKYGVFDIFYPRDKAQRKLEKALSRESRK